METLDPDAKRDKFPQGYEYDLSLLTPARKLIMHIDPGRHFVDTHNLAYNSLIRFLTPDPHFPPPVSDSGKTLLDTFGATVGQALIRMKISLDEADAEKSKPGSDKKKIEKALKTAKKDTKANSAVVDQFARSTLWRTANNPVELTGWSGTPLEIVDIGGVIGFQNWMWMMLGHARRGWGQTLDDLDGQSVEDAELRMKNGCYALYGSYKLPDYFIGYKIVPSTEVGGADIEGGEGDNELYV